MIKFKKRLRNEKSVIKSHPRKLGLCNNNNNNIMKKKLNTQRVV